MPRLGPGNLRAARTGPPSPQGGRSPWYPSTSQDLHCALGSLQPGPSSAACSGPRVRSALASWLPPEPSGGGSQRRAGDRSPAAGGASAGSQGSRERGLPGPEAARAAGEGGRGLCCRHCPGRKVEPHQVCWPETRPARGRFLPARSGPDCSRRPGSTAGVPFPASRPRRRRRARQGREPGPGREAAAPPAPSSSEGGARSKEQAVRKVRPAFAHRLAEQGELPAPGPGAGLPGGVCASRSRARRGRGRGPGQPRPPHLGSLNSLLPFTKRRSWPPRPRTPGAWGWKPGRRAACGAVVLKQLLPRGRQRVLGPVAAGPGAGLRGARPGPGAFVRRPLQTRARAGAPGHVHLAVAAAAAASAAHLGGGRGGFSSLSNFACPFRAATREGNE